MPWRKLKDLTLQNAGVQLRRIGLHDREQLASVAFDPEIWRYFVTRVTSETELDRFIEEAIRDTLNGTRIVFAIIDPQTERIVGSTAFGNIVESERKLEIGWSWLGKSARGSGINRATKLALLDYAFDVLACERVEFKTDVLNTGARRGLSGIGAQEEGVLRSFNFMPDGRRRDAIYYSILKAEWPAVRAERFAQWTR